MALYSRTLGVALALTFGCNQEAIETMQAAPDGGDPWLLWGTSEEILLTTETAAVMGGIASSQLSNVEYRHPTTWTILVAASVIWEPAAALMGIQVNFNLRFGVGRSLLELPPVPIQWGDPELQPDGIGDLKVITEFPLDPLVPGGDPSMLSKFPAQSIQIGADVRSLAPMGAGTTIRATVTSFAAPVTHVRPDWFLGHMEAELNGR